jgi:hypothetical protein
MRVVVLLSLRMFLAFFEHFLSNRVIFDGTFSSFTYSFDHFRVLVCFIPAERLLNVFFCERKMIDEIFLNQSEPEIEVK